MAKGELKIEFIARVAWVESGRILVCRNLKHGHCYLPGGHVEFGESASAAAAREMMEEAGVSVHVGPPLQAFELRFEQRGKQRHEVTILFHVAHAECHPSRVKSIEEEIAFEMVPVGELERAKFLPSSQLAWVQEWCREGCPTPQRFWTSGS